MNNQIYELMILADKYAMYAFGGDDTTIARRALKDALLAHTQPSEHHMPVFTSPPNHVSEDKLAVAVKALKKILSLEKARADFDGGYNCINAKTAEQALSTIGEDNG